MDDLNFRMRTGFSNSDQIEHHDSTFLRKLVALTKVLMQDAVLSAEKFANSCGRKRIRARDINLALKFQAHEFLQQENLEEKFFSSLAEEEQHTYASDSEDSGEEDEDSEEDGEEDGGEEDGEDNEEEDSEEDGEENEDSFILKTNDSELRKLHEKFMAYDAEWESWNPSDEVSCFLKKAIDKTEAALN